MWYSSLADGLTALRQVRPGLTAVILCETDFLLAQTAEHLSDAGFTHLIAAGPGAKSAPERDDLIAMPADIAGAENRADVVNKLISAAAGRWMLVCFNGEFLFYPYRESRLAQDFTEFLSWERRPAAMSYAVDIYSDALGREEDAFSLEDVYFDTQGWYGFERGEKQAEVFGGLGWRFEEFTPRDMTRVNRPALFWADPAVPMRADMWFEDDVYNAISCPWHNNPTFALMSVRRATALRRHPNFSAGVRSFMWPCSEKFSWNSQQLLKHGVIEAGQWL